MNLTIVLLHGPSHPRQSAISDSFMEALKLALLHTSRILHLICCALVIEYRIYQLGHPKGRSDTTHDGSHDIESLCSRLRLDKIEVIMRGIDANQPGS